MCLELQEIQHTNVAVYDDTKICLDLGNSVLSSLEISAF